VGIDTSRRHPEENDMARKLFLLAGAAFLIAAVAFGISGNWTFVFVNLAIGLGCVAVALMQGAEPPGDDAPAGSPTS
jgi:hypothetical protein